MPSWKPLAMDGLYGGLSNMKKLSFQQKQFYDAVAQILWEEWDPIGVYEADSEWNDEYDSYVPLILRLAIEGRDSYKIAQELSTNAEVNMGCSPSREHDMEIATKMEILG